MISEVGEKLCTVILNKKYTYNIEKGLKILKWVVKTVNRRGTDSTSTI